MAGELTFAKFADANLTRCEDPSGFNHKVHSWDTNEWMVAILVELGEAANNLKKMNRERHKVRGNHEIYASYRAKLLHELADVFVYLDLIFQSLDEDLETHVVKVFNAKSDEIGYEGEARL